MKRVVRYLLENDGTIPVFVENGGYFPIGTELVGVSVDEDLQHVPVTVARMSKADLTARLEAMTISGHPLDNPGELNSAAKAAMLDVWLEMVGMSDLA